ncbi:Bug family tripartite tricarboxylate transporter substrate binding protein [Billgrantia aerodenitrificans]|uniref:Tripartite tricarboxylate transporter substrate binding protein n=1 Tax=Billgrantia aerodenitrificans TaxID=2733483 RepID=A0ABS9AMV3_9GAMM|nr:tripartite tricarboxylate transporter substrate binding protein [Halomonas aerodenitrificans]MCE8023171.1 tripartite tricarboxylate transporter substrate binding protein [Halomonas aerodenitrificans]
MISNKSKLIASAALASVATFSHLSVAQDNSYPSERLNYIIAFGPGGGNDLMSRTVVDILNDYDLYGGQNIVVANRAGGSGAIGYSYVKRQQGNPYVATSTSGNFITTPLIADTDWNYSDFTPIALLASDAMFLVVREDSEYRSVDEFVEAAQSSRIIVGGTGSAGPSRVVASLFSDEAEIRLEYVPAGTGGEMVTALTSGSVEAIVANPSEVAGQIAAGNFRALAFSDAQRSDIYPDVPTFQELGYDFTFALPRGVVLPGGVDADVQEWWISALKEVVETEEWNKYLETNSLSGTYLWGEEFGDYLQETSEVYESTLRSIGAIE